MSDAETVERIVLSLRNLRVRTANKRAGQPLWYVVAQLLACGCTAANEWCEARGLDPNQRTREVRW